MLMWLKERIHHFSSSPDVQKKIAQMKAIASILHKGSLRLLGKL